MPQQEGIICQKNESAVNWKILILLQIFFTAKKGIYG